MKSTKFLTKTLVLVIMALVTLTLVGCRKPEPEPGEPTQVEKTYVDDGKDYTYNTYTTLSPSNWNELTYQDNNDTQIMSYIGDSFFLYDFKYDAKGEILPGEFEMKYGAATKLEDVTAEYAEEWNLPAEGKGYAYKITLREDLAWSDGTRIFAEDFVYTMQEQLNPLFQNYRADSFYVGGTIIHNAENYAKQGQTLQAAVSTIMANKGYATIADFVAGEATSTLFVNWDYSFGDTYKDGAWTGSAEDAIVEAGLNAADLYQLFSDTVTGWGYDQATADEFFMGEVYLDYTFPAVSWDEVGMFAAGKYEIVLVLDKALPLLKEDGSLSYQAAYNMSSLPLVKKDLYESCKQAPTGGSTLWTSNYNSSVETTASWGPYKLETYQSGKEYVITRNEYWWGYKVYEGLYQTDKIVCETIEEWQTAWLKFLAGEIDGIGIDVSVADEYKNSDRAYFTPDDFVASLQLQSSEKALKEREEAGIDKEILANVKFRQALSLAIDRQEFAAKTTTSSLQGFGLFNSMHYYDVENGGVYRNSDDAKQVLCDIYGVDVSKYESLDAAAAAITGFDLELARQLLTEAYNEQVAAEKISETDKVKLTMGSGAINATVQRRFDFLQNAWTELCKGTPLEGRIEFEVKDFQTAWATDFRAGAYDVCMGGWTGAAWDPGYFLLAYLSPSYMYSAAWDTSSVMLEFTMKGVGENGADITDTMSLIDWYNCLNGASSAKYDFSANALEQSQRLQLIAALEKEVLKVYYTVPLYNNFSASLISFKCEYTTYEYNTFMGYGGLKYMTYNFTDAEWATVVAEQGGELDYK